MANRKFDSCSSYNVAIELVSWDWEAATGGGAGVFEKIRGLSRKKGLIMENGVCFALGKELGRKIPGVGYGECSVLGINSIKVT